MVYIRQNRILAHCYFYFAKELLHIYFEQARHYVHAFDTNQYITKIVIQCSIKTFYPLKKHKLFVPLQTAGKNYISVSGYVSLLENRL